VASRRDRRRPPHRVSGTRELSAVRRMLAEHAGRAWINGREVGGTDPRWSHLTRSYD
jgi:hypothetical protein